MCVYVAPLNVYKTRPYDDGNGGGLISYLRRLRQCVGCLAAMDKGCSYACIRIIIVTLLYVVCSMQPAVVHSTRSM